MRLLICLWLAVTPSIAAAQARYTAKQIGDVVQLRDARTDTVVSVMTPLGNAYEMVVKGQNVIRQTFASADEFRARPGLNGIPLLAPFANPATTAPLLGCPARRARASARWA